MTGEPKIKVCELWERESAKGLRYFSGYWGNCQVVMFDDGMKPHPKRPDEQVHVWKLFLQGRATDSRQPPKPETALDRRHRIGRELGARQYDRDADHVAGAPWPEEKQS